MALAGAEISKRTISLTAGFSRKCTNASAAERQRTAPASTGHSQSQVGQSRWPRRAAASPAPQQQLPCIRRYPAAASSDLSPDSSPAAAAPSRERRSKSGSFLQHRRQRLGDDLALEQLLAREHLVQHHAERPDVGALVHRLAARLLRSHVRRRAQDHARPRRSRWSASANSRGSDAVATAAPPLWPSRSPAP